MEMQTARRLFRTENQDMGMPMSAAQGTSEDKVFRAKGLGSCNLVTQMPGNIVCSFIQSSFIHSSSIHYSFCKLNFIKHWLYASCGHLKGCRSGKDALSIIKAAKEGSPFAGKGFSSGGFPFSMGLKGARSPSTAGMSELSNK